MVKNLGFRGLGLFLYTGFTPKPRKSERSGRDVPVEDPRLITPSVSSGCRVSARRVSAFRVPKYCQVWGLLGANYRNPRFKEGVHIDEAFAS